MKRAVFWGIALMFTLPSVHAQDPAAEEYLLFSKGSERWVENFQLESTVIAELPKWSPLTKRKPPIDLAYVLGETVPLFQQASNGWPWQIGGIYLYSGRSEATQNVWYIEVPGHIDLDLNPKRIDPVPFGPIFLMDGTVLATEPRLSEKVGEMP